MKKARDGSMLALKPLTRSRHLKMLLLNGVALFLPAVFTSGRKAVVKVLKPQPSLNPSTKSLSFLLEFGRSGAKGVRVCVMCSEADYTKCHRYSTITPSLHRHDVEVFHIEYAMTVNGGKRLTRQTPQNLRKPKKPNPKQSKLL